VFPRKWSVKCANEDSDPNERPTANVLLEHSSFCEKNPYYNFYDTQLAAKLRSSDMGA
jgi:hypothetical protein